MRNRAVIISLKTNAGQTERELPIIAFSLYLITFYRINRLHSEFIVYIKN